MTINHKSAVVQEAEEIIENYIRKQASLSHRFKIKSKRKIPAGMILLLVFGVSLLLWILLLAIIF